MESSSEERMVLESNHEGIDQSDKPGFPSSEVSHGYRHENSSAPHSYLGEMDDIACSSVLLEEGSIVTLPLFYMEVLFPGATIPMRLLESRDKAAIELAVHCNQAPFTVGVVHRSRAPVFRYALVGTTAVIKQLTYGHDGSVNIVAKGFQRFRTIHVWQNADGAICGQACILSEESPLHIPRDAFGKLACVLSFQSGKDHPTLVGQKQNELKLLKESSSAGIEEKSCLDNSQTIESSSHDDPSRVMKTHEWSSKSGGSKTVVEIRPTNADKEGSLSSCTQEDDCSSDHIGRRRDYRRRWALDASKSLSMGQCSAWPHWVYRMHDAYYLARHAADLWQQLVGFESVYNLVRRPEMLAYHIASRIPVQDSIRQELLEIHGVTYRLRKEIHLLESMNNLNCKWCFALIANRSDILVMSGEGPVDTFVNPHGIVHETLTLFRTEGLNLVGDPETLHSWFPGYSWTLAYCRVCNAHMGWHYKAVEEGLQPKSFWGIRRSQLAQLSK
ncbi:hypothetical protein KP509_09G053000 [Ceratopteris richardii]|uniref:Protein cereblon n=1 Tax=Ceratopteris richardii TaxID=49495 RepID=A0A8T2U6G1_CERRI|nr:hypothetical protein KP509_09G053000 [Ceratopteris richardii]